MINYFLRKTGALCLAAFMAMTAVLAVFPENIQARAMSERVLTGYSRVEIYSGSKIYAGARDTFDYEVSYSTDGGTTWSSETPYLIDAGELNIIAKSAPEGKPKLEISYSLKVIPREVSIKTKSAWKTYDGSALTKNTKNDIEYTGFSDDEIKKLTVTVTGSQTNAGESKNSFTYSLGEGMKAENYHVTCYPGTLRVLKRYVLVKACSSYNEYTGDAITDDYYSIQGDGFVAGDVQSITCAPAEPFTGSNGSNSSTPNIPTIHWAREGAEENYSVTKVNGRLCVSGSSSLKVWAIGEVCTYDGQAHSINYLCNKMHEGVRIEFSVDDQQTWKGETEVPVLKDVGEYTVYVRATDSNGNTSIDSVLLKVEARPVTFTASSFTHIYDGNTWNADKFDDVLVGGLGYATSSDGVEYPHWTTDIMTASVVDAGDPVENKINTDAITDDVNGFKKANYDITTESGWITITRRKIYITSPSICRVYNGKAGTTENDFLYCSGDSFASYKLPNNTSDRTLLTENLTGSRKDVGISDNTYSYSWTDTVTGANYEITEGTGTLEVVPAEILIKPDEGQTAVYGEEAVLTYKKPSVVGGETFTASGKLGYEDFPGDRDITLGTLALNDNEDFKKNNYTLKLAKETVYITAVMSSVTIDEIKPKTYTGYPICPDITVKLGGRTLVNGEDYTLSYDHNRNVGTATVTVTGAGSFTGSKVATFEIINEEEQKKAPLTGDTARILFFGILMFLSFAGIGMAIRIKYDRY